MFNKSKQMLNKIYCASKIAMYLYFKIVIKSNFAMNYCFLVVVFRKLVSFDIYLEQCQ